MSSFSPRRAQYEEDERLASLMRQIQGSYGGSYAGAGLYGYSQTEEAEADSEELKDNNEADLGEGSEDAHSMQEGGEEVDDEARVRQFLDKLDASVQQMREREAQWQSGSASAAMAE